MSRASAQWFRETRQVFDYLNEHGLGLDTLVDGHQRGLRSGHCRRLDHGAHRHGDLRPARYPTAHDSKIYHADELHGSFHRRRKHGQRPDPRPHRARPAAAEHQRRRSRTGAAYRARRRTGRARLRRQPRNRRGRRRRGARGEAAGHGGHGAVRSPKFSRDAPPLVLSIAAGIRVADIASWCGPGVAVVRAMPNRPALNSAGATAHLCAGRR